MKGVKRTADEMREHLASYANEDGCWRFGNVDHKGYGLVHFEAHLRLAHRVAYELFVGPIPAGLDIDHLCTVRACCNPAHLEPVTRKENIRRRIERSKQVAA